MPNVDDKSQLLFKYNESDKLNHSCFYNNRSELCRQCIIGLLLSNKQLRMFHSIYWFDFFQYEPVKASNNSNHCSNLILYYINNRFNCYCDDLELIWKRKKRRKNGIHAAIDEFLPLVKRISGRHWSTSPGNGALHTLRFSSGHINQTEYSRETRLEQTTDIEPMATN